MSKPNRSIQVPDAISEALEALAKHKRITQSELIVRILTMALDDPLLLPYVKDGRFDDALFQQDLARNNETLAQWYRDNPHELDWIADVALYPGGSSSRRKAS